MLVAWCPGVIIRWCLDFIFFILVSVDFIGFDPEILEQKEWQTVLKYLSIQDDLLRHSSIMDELMRDKTFSPKDALVLLIQYVHTFY